MADKRLLARAVKHVSGARTSKVPGSAIGLLFSAEEREDLRKRHGGLLAFLEKSRLFALTFGEGGEVWFSMRKDAAVPSGTAASSPGARGAAPVTDEELVCAVASVVYDLQQKAGGSGVPASHAGGAFNSIPKGHRELIKKRFSSMGKVLERADLFTLSGSGDKSVKLTAKAVAMLRKAGRKENDARTTKRATGGNASSQTPSTSPLTRTSGSVASATSIPVVSPATQSASSASRSDDDPFVYIIDNEVSAEDAMQQMRRQSLVVVDCQVLKSGTSGGTLCLVMIALEDTDSGGDATEQVLVFDVLACPALLISLKEVMESTDIVKCFHNIQPGAAALAGHDIKLSGCIDAQVAHSLITGHRNGSLEALLEHFGLSRNMGALNRKVVHKRDAPYWSKRPISKEDLWDLTSNVLLLRRACAALFAQLRSPDTLDQLMRDSAARVKNAEGRNNKPSAPRMESSDVLARISERCKQQGDRVIPYSRGMLAEVGALLNVLPNGISGLIQHHLPDFSQSLIDVVMDLERPLRLIRNNGSSVDVHECVILYDDLQHVLAGCGRITDANRACVGSSLHRCSVIRDGCQDEVVGLTLRMARVVEGVATTLEDILVSGKSVLLIGAPGRGKTTLLRDVAQLMSSPSHDRRVMIVDTNNEIGGEGVLPHAAIGRARRMKVGARSRQFRVMLEAVQNHTPEMLVIDEIGTSQEANEAIAIRQRGVQLIATTHGECIGDVIRNPSVRALMGGVNAVILSAGETAQQGARGKTRLERKTPPAFDVCIELLSMSKWRVHYDVEKVVDAVLRGMGEVVACELRELEEDVVRVSTGQYPDENDVASGFGSVAVGPSDI